MKNLLFFPVLIITILNTGYSQETKQRKVEINYGAAIPTGKFASGSFRNPGFVPRNGWIFSASYNYNVKDYIGIEIMFEYMSNQTDENAITNAYTNSNSLYTISLNNYTDWQNILVMVDPLIEDRR